MTMRRARVALAMVALASFTALFTPACASPTEELCSQICACEHCNRGREATTCDALAGQREVARDYGCDAEFDAWVSCRTDKGSCHDSTATYSSRPAGRCDGSSSTGLTCASDGDCALNFGSNSGVFCQVGTCVHKACSDGVGAWCIHDDDCSPGPDACGDAQQSVNACVQKASAHPGEKLR